MLGIAASSSAEVSRYRNTILDTSGRRSSTPIPAGSKRFARYDFLLVFRSDLRSLWNRC